MPAHALRCRNCGRTYTLAPQYVCEECLGPLETERPRPAVDAEALRARIGAGPASLWRYEDLLPVAHDPVADLGAGLTPLVHASTLGGNLGLRRLFLKNDGCNPTWSFKDRVVTLGVAAARQFGFQVLACASTGNLANSVAAHAARAGIQACVFVPEGLEAGKQVLSAVYGATIVEVDGTYDDVNRLCAQVADEYPWGFVNVNLRPYYSEGAKTLGYEVAEQLGWRLPDHVVIPLASGNLLLKIERAFAELVELGIVPPARVRVHGAQPSGCAPIVAAYREGSESVRPVRPQTIAHSLAIGNPADGRYALEAIRRSGGVAVEVTDAEAVAAVREVAAREGVFTETAGGVAVAALRRLAAGGIFGPDDVIVVYLTGIGLKTQESVAGTLREPVKIRATLGAFEAEVLPGLAQVRPRAGQAVGGA
ncbi:MAG: threonine synthase [Armatimonadetes bacterium]|nr:threonine synthase [Armatimonadota bacterium]